MSAKVLSSLFSAVLIVNGYVGIRERVQGSAQADFIYASQVNTTSDGKMEIENSITNNAAGLLAVQWDDAGIICNGFAQLAPKEVQSKKGMAQDPYLYDHSEIRYGNGMQYFANARCYRDGQARPRDRTQTQVTRRDPGGNEKYKIEVKSEVSQDRRSATMSFIVKGNLSLVLPSRVATELKTIAKGGAWEIIKTPSLDVFDIQEGDRQTIQMWLDKTPVPKRDRAAPSFLVLYNKNGDSGEVTLPLAGANWGLEQINVIAYVPGTPGVLGFTADVYLPG